MILPVAALAGITFLVRRNSRIQHEQDASHNKEDGHE